LALLIWHQGVYTDFWTSLRHVAFNLVSIATDCGFRQPGLRGLADVRADVDPDAVVLLREHRLHRRGIKMVRTLVLFQQAKRELYLLVHPSAVTPVRIGSQVVQNKVVFAVLAFVVLYFGTVVVLTFALLLTGLDFVSSFSAIIACINNAGPGLARSGPPRISRADRPADLDLLDRDAARAPRDLQRAGAVHPTLWRK